MSEVRDRFEWPRHWAEVPLLGRVGATHFVLERHELLERLARYGVGLPSSGPI